MFSLVTNQFWVMMAKEIQGDLFTVCRIEVDTIPSTLGAEKGRCLYSQESEKRSLQGLADGFPSMVFRLVCQEMNCVYLCSDPHFQVASGLIIFGMHTWLMCKPHCDSFTTFCRKSHKQKNSCCPTEPNQV